MTTFESPEPTPPEPTESCQCSACHPPDEDSESYDTPISASAQAKLSSVTISKIKDDGYTVSGILRKLAECLSEQEIDILVKLASRGPLTYLGQGSDRIGFLLPRGNTVLKVQKNGFDQNGREYRAYRNGRKLNRPVAACRPLTKRLMFMRAVTPVQSDNDNTEAIAAWEAAGYARLNDWVQCGHTKRGKLVCLDAGIE